MPGINVIDSDGDIQSFEEATTWHIDDRGQLHLNNAEGPVASFAKDKWEGAGTAESTGPAVSRETMSAVLDELREIRALLDPARAAEAIGKELNKAATRGNKRVLR